MPWLLMLTACGPSGRDATPSLSADAIYTAAYQTFSAQLALTPATDTPAPTASSTQPPPTASGSIIQSACDNSTFLSDVTIPDGTVMAAGAPFVKTWVLQNNGSCTWNTSYKLAFYSGDLMSGSAAALPNAVAAGQQVTISVNLVAPTAAGTYKGTWRMHNDKGQAFGDFPYVAISVGAGAAATTATCHTSSKNAVTIAGHAGPENATISYGDGTTVTDANGNYTFAVPKGWTGTVTPTKAKVHPWTFEPAHRFYTNVACDLIHENYVATAPPGT
jgi:hypothetical protein